MNTDVLVKENTKANVKTESDTKMLDRTFKTVGNEYGYNDVSAEFVAFRTEDQMDTINGKSGIQSVRLFQRFK
jgi:hypothetical protein